MARVKGAQVADPRNLRGELGVTERRFREARRQSSLLGRDDPRRAELVREMQMLREMGSAQTVEARSAERAQREALRDEFGVQPNRINPEYTEYVRGQVERGGYQPDRGPSAAERAAPFMREREMRRLGVSGGEMAELEGLRREIDPQAARAAALPDIRREVGAELAESRERSGVFDALGRAMERDTGLRDRAREMTGGSPSSISAADARSLMGGLGGGVEGGRPAVNAAATPAPPPPAQLPNPDPAARLAFDQAMARERRMRNEMANETRLGEARQAVASLDADRAAERRREAQVADAVAAQPGLANDAMRAEIELARMGLAPQETEAGGAPPSVTTLAGGLGTTPEIAQTIVLGFADDFGKAARQGILGAVGMGGVAEWADSGAMTRLDDTMDQLRALPASESRIVARDLIAQLVAEGVWSIEPRSQGARTTIGNVKAELQSLAAGGAENIAQR